MIYIFDIDGTIADDSHRIEWYNKGEYAEYHGRFENDTPTETLFLAKEIDSRNNSIVFLSGRPRLWREKTHIQLTNWLDHCNFQLMLRGDYLTSTSEYKVKMLKNVLKHKKAAVFIDDKPENRQAVEAAYPFVSVFSPAQACAVLKPKKRLVPAASQKQKADVSADTVLAEMSKTFKERNAVYKDNYKKVGQVMSVLFPDGVQLNTAADFDKWHLFELMIVKLTRFVNADLNHKDSIHDIAVYSAMIEAILENENES
jgi:NADH dehydrogenase/NADH:ubiquinone oxidoreductase subunit G